MFFSFTPKYEGGSTEIRPCKIYILKYAILLHISIHQRQEMCVLLLICKILTDILHGNERVDLDAKILADLHNGGLARVLTDLTAVYRNEHIGNLHICAALEHRHGLTDSGACGDYILDDDHAVAVLRLVADDIAAFAVVLGLLAVEEERLVDTVIAGQRTGNRGSKRDALVRRTEHCVELIADGLLDQSCVKLTQTGVLQTGLVVAGIDEIREIGRASCRERV